MVISEILALAVLISESTDVINDLCFDVNIDVWLTRVHLFLRIVLLEELEAL